jgi:hypothetical protein
LRRILLTIAGVVQILIIALHVAMFFGMARATEIPGPLKPLLHIFNAAVLTTVIFFAYVSLFRRKELIETPLGHATCWFMALFYAQRGLTAAFLRGVQAVDLVPMVVIAALYVIPALPERRRRATSVTASAPAVETARA